jgi:general nucleoside transport system permease protein
MPRAKILLVGARAGISIGTVAVALGLGAVVLLLLDASPIEGYRAMVDGAFGSSDAITDTLLKSVPLLLVGAGICVAFRANVINIGGEGQIIAGALASTAVGLWLGDLPRPILLPILLVAGLVGGGVLGGVPGYLKAYHGVNEILSTIMLNIVAVQVMNYLLRGPLIDPLEVERGTNVPQTARLSDNTDLPTLIPDSRIHIGVLVAVTVAVGTWVLLWRTPFGFRIRAVGQNASASRYAGMPVERSVMLSLAISGALSGLAGTMLVLGSASHRMVTDGSAAGFTGNAGFNGIVVALFGGLHPLVTIGSSVLFGALLVGANAMQRAVQVPSALVVALNGTIVLFVVSSERLRGRVAAMVGLRTRGDDESPAPVAEPVGVA